jgi:S1-C subfamily serine protease
MKLWCIFACLAGISAVGFEKSAVSEATARSVWLETDRSIASGVIVETGLVVTNHHVIAGAKDVTVDDVMATVVRTDEAHDLALLAVTTREIERIRFGRELSLNEEVLYVGNPGGRKNHLAEGRITGILPDRLKTSAWGYPGFSGSGLYNKRGELAGVNFEFNFRVGDIEPKGDSIPAQVVRTFLGW